MNPKIIMHLLEYIEENTEQGYSQLDAQNLTEYLEAHYPPHAS